MITYTAEPTEPDPDGALPVPLRVRTDPAHGGRWTSLRTDPHPGTGAVFDRDGSPPSEVAVVPPTGEVSWRLTITAARVAGPPGRPA